MPHRSLKTAASLFSHRDTCGARGDKVMPSDAEYYEPFPTENARRRLMQLGEQSSTEMPPHPFLESLDDAQQGRALQQLQPEFGTERDRHLFSRAQNIKQVQSVNLRTTGWLGDFEPMMANCPLTARKVAPEAISEFASIAWRCDGLGFAWECLQAETLQPDGSNAQDAAVEGVTRR